MEMLTIRKATNSDITTIQNLAVIVWIDTYNKLLSPEQMGYMLEMMYSTVSLEEQITNDNFLLIYNKTELVAYISISQEGDDMFTLQKLYVSPQVQGKGVGRFAIDKGVEYIKKQFNKKDITLSLFVNRDNKAVEFYKKLGFEILDERDFNIGNDFYMNDYIMQRVY